MRNKIIISLILTFVTFSYLGAKEIDAKKKPKIDRDQPIQIVSKRMDAYNEERMVVFSGNAVATQGDKVIKSDRLLFYYKKDSRVPEKTGSQNIGSTGDLEKIEAKGHVTITQGQRVVTGENAVFYQDSQEIIVTGSAVMSEGKNVIQGDRIVVYLNEDRGVVEGLEKNRVNATIYPEDRKDKKNRTPAAEFFKFRHVNAIDHKRINGDDFVKSPSAFAEAVACCVALHVSSLQRKSVNYSFPGICAPYLWGFLQYDQVDIQVF